MRDKRLATAVATLLVAFSTAHLMQFGLSAGQLLSDGGSAAPIGLATLLARRDTASPEAPTAAQALPLSPLVPRADPARQDCARHLTVRPGPDAIIETTLAAPCDAGARVELAHAGLRFSLVTGAEGLATAAIPAMRTEATVTARFPDGEVLTAQASVPEAARFDRAALVAEGWTGLSLRPEPQRSGPSGEGRFAGGTLRLGDPALDAPVLTEVHSLPAGRFGSLAQVRLVLEAVVIPENCGREVGATFVTSRDPEAPTSLALVMPACEAEGEIMVLPLTLVEPRLARQ